MTTEFSPEQFLLAQLAVFSIKVLEYIMITLMKLSSSLHLLESWDQKYQKSLPVSGSHLVKQNVVVEWVPLESGSETMTVSVYYLCIYTTGNRKHCIYAKWLNECACVSAHVSSTRDLVG